MRRGRSQTLVSGAEGKAQRPQPGAPAARPAPPGAPPAPRDPACPHILGSCDLRAHPRPQPPHSIPQPYPDLHQPLLHHAMQVKPQITPNSLRSVSHQGLGHFPLAQREFWGHPGALSTKTHLVLPLPRPSPKPRTQLGSRAHTPTPLQPSPAHGLRASAHQQGRDTL